MKIKEIIDLSVEELDLYEKSELYHTALNNYAICDTHLKYYKEYFGEEWKDLSLVAFDNEGYYLCMYICFYGTELSFWGNPINVYSVDMDVKKEIRIYQELFAKLESYKDEYGISNVRIYDNPHFTLKYFDSDNFNISIEHFSYINLNQDKDDIKMTVRKSYKSLINWGYRNLEIKTLDSSNITIETMNQFEDFHIRVSGRRTRSHESWLLQYEAVKNDMGYVILGFLDNSLVAAVLVINSLSEAYYGVAVNNRDLMAQNLPIGHAILLEAIFEAKKKGLKRFNLGNVSHTENDKLNAIAKYKRGFSPVVETKVVYNIAL